MIEIEEFRDVPGYEGLYEVSNLGRVKNIKTGRILKPHKHRGGYLLINLCKSGTMRTDLIHRLVANSFLPNPQNLPCVNHKDEDKTNNAISNLEWCTYEYNNNYGTRNERMAEKKSKPVLQFDLLGNFIREWTSIRQAIRDTGVNNIAFVLSGRLKTAGGYLWKYKN